jgi:hypothetical protein
MADPTVDVAIFRDSDSVVNFRELAAVEEWLAAKDITLHSMNDHPGHPWPLMAGMFGVNLNSRPDQRGEAAEKSTRDTMATMLINMFHYASMGINYFKEADQTLLFAVVATQFERSKHFINFLKCKLLSSSKLFRIFFAIVPGSNDWLRHDSIHCKETIGVHRTRPFPKKRDPRNDGVEFVGSIISNPLWILEYFNSSISSPNISFHNITARWISEKMSSSSAEPCHV